MPVNKHNIEETQMALTLLEPNRIMDPLIAAQVYNRRHGAIGRLPEEILIQIVKYCQINDVLSLFCLWRVSRRFRFLINEAYPRYKSRERDVSLPRH